MVRKLVELMLVLVLSAVVSAYGRDRESFVAHVIDDSAGGAASLHACDLDGDGDTDLVGALLEDSAVVWWRNDGKATAWTRFVVDGRFRAAISVYTGDLDGDGEDDVAGAAAMGDEIAWWRSEGGNPGGWKKYSIRTGYDFAHEVYLHDLDLDGDVDVLGASSNLDEITWWRNDGGDPVAWTEQKIGDRFIRAKSVRVADLDDDGDLDVVGAALHGNEVAWWRNDGGEPIRWEKVLISGDFEGAHRVQVLDFDGDGDVDILGAAYFGGEIAWWENDGNFVKQTIGSDFPRACIAAWADMDDDGDLDVVGSSQEGNEVAMWWNDGGSPVHWVKLHVDSLVRVWPLCLADLDADGDTDIVAGSGFRGVNRVMWWENR